MIDVRSIVNGIKAMGGNRQAMWSIKWLPKEFWLDAWTPVWHEGRGPYLSCGLWIIAIFRGY